jgi:hypothetical protein
MSAPESPNVTDPAREAGLHFATHDSVTERANLVAFGVCPMSLVETYSANEVGITETISSYLNRVAAEARVLPFVLVGEERVNCGFAAEPWVVDLLTFALTSKDAKPHKHKIIRLLLGHSPAAIRRHEDFGAAVVVRRTTGAGRSL